MCLGAWVVDVLTAKIVWKRPRTDRGAIVSWHGVALRTVVDIFTDTLLDKSDVGMSELNSFKMDGSSKRMNDAEVVDLETKS